MKKYNSRMIMVAIIAMFFTTTIYAQNFQGVATYQSSMKMGQFKIGGDNMTPEMEKQIAAQLKKQSQKEYTLKFNLTESLWKEVESLGAGGAPSASSGGGNVVFRISTSGGNGSLYKNTASMEEIEETEVFSKPFLVKDELVTREWELTDDTKKIGNYTVQKAIFTKISERKVMSFSNIGSEEGDEEMKTVSDTVKIEAWYAPQIPVSQGPSNYWGLPGLILELKDGKTTYLCTKVVLNPEEGVKIKVPSKGKKVSRKELAEITRKKSEEMMKNFKNGKGSSSFTISTGG